MDLRCGPYGWVRPHFLSFKQFRMPISMHLAGFGHREATELYLFQTASQANCPAVTTRRILGFHHHARNKKQIPDMVLTTGCDHGKPKEPSLHSGEPTIRFGVRTSRPPRSEYGRSTPPKRRRGIGRALYKEPTYAQSCTSARPSTRQNEITGQRN
jgi:hypothetical protein